MYTGLRTLTADTIAAWFVRLLLKLRRKTGIICRECESPVAPELVSLFVTEGCPACGSTKLEMR